MLANAVGGFFFRPKPSTARPLARARGGSSAGPERLVLAPPPSSDWPQFAPTKSPPSSCKRPAAVWPTQKCHQQPTEAHDETETRRAERKEHAAMPLRSGRDHRREAPPRQTAKGKGSTVLQKSSAALSKSGRKSSASGGGRHGVTAGGDGGGVKHARAALEHQHLQHEQPAAQSAAVSTKSAPCALGSTGGVRSDVQADGAQRRRVVGKDELSSSQGDQGENDDPNSQQQSAGRQAAGDAGSARHWRSTEYVSDWQYRSGAITKNTSPHGSGTQTQTQTHEPGWQRRWSKKKKKRNRR